MQSEKTMFRVPTPMIANGSAGNSIVEPLSPPALNPLARPASPEPKPLSNLRQCGASRFRRRFIQNAAAAALCIVVIGLSSPALKAQGKVLKVLNAAFTPTPIQVDGVPEDAWSKVSPSVIAGGKGCYRHDRFSHPADITTQHRICLKGYEGVGKIFFVSILRQVPQNCTVRALSSDGSDFSYCGRSRHRAMQFNQVVAAEDSICSAYRQAAGVLENHFSGRCLVLISYVPEPVWRIGFLTVHPYGLLFALGMTVGSFVVLNRASLVGLSERSASLLLLIGLPVGILGARLMSWIFDGRASGLSSLGSILAVILALGAYARWRPSLLDQFWKWLDVIGYASVFAWFIGRIGCSMAHDHPGRLTASFMGVRFPGGNRYDLGLLECCYLGIFLIVMLVIDRQSWSHHSGVMFGIITFCYGSFRICIEHLREGGIRRLGLNVDQYAAAVLVAISLCSLRAAIRCAKMTWTDLKPS